MNTTLTPWEAVELELVAQTYGDPAWTVKQIAEKLERTATEIYAAAKLLGVQRPKRRLDYARIAELKSQGLSDDAIANLMGCSKGGVQGALRSINEKHHVEKRKQRELREKTNKPWKEREKQFLADHYSKPNWDCHRIAVELRRSEASVYRKAFDMGLKKGKAA